MIIPWRFFIALPLGFFTALLLFVGLLYTQLGVPTEMTQWVHDISQEKESYAAQRPGARLFLVAGSSALFGLNAQLIQQQTGWPTVNMGTSAGLSLDYRFSRLEKAARAGDTVLLALEYEAYANGVSVYSDFNDDYVLARDPEYFYRISLLGKIDMATRIPFARLQKGWKNRSSPPRLRPASPIAYSPILPGLDCVDDNGDEVYNTAAQRPAQAFPINGQITLLIDGLPSNSTAGFSVVSAFLLWAEAHHVAVLAAFPATIDHHGYHGPLGLEAIQTITRFYSAHHVPVLGTAQEAMLPADQFFDSVYHLTHEAALQRTGRLIPELLPYQPRKQ